MQSWNLRDILGEFEKSRPQESFRHEIARRLSQMFLWEVVEVLKLTKYLLISSVTGNSVNDSHNGLFHNLPTRDFLDV